MVHASIQAVLNRMKIVGGTFGLDYNINLTCFVVAIVFNL